MTTFYFPLWRIHQKAENCKYSVWILPNIWRLKWVRDTKFGTNVSNKMLLNAGKYQGYRFYHFWVSKGKPTERVNLTPAPTKIKVKSLKMLLEITKNLTRILKRSLMIEFNYMEFPCFQTSIKLKIGVS